MIMTGAMCIVAQGSSLQLVIATIVMLLYMLLVLKTAPFEEDTEDWSSFIGCFALCMTTFGGVCLITDDPLNRTFEPFTMAVILITLNVLSMTAQLSILILLDCGVWDRVFMRRKKKLDRSSRGRRMSSVLPMTLTKDLALARVKQLREVRLLYGAGSDEYKEVAIGLDQMKDAKNNAMPIKNGAEKQVDRTKVFPIASTNEDNDDDDSKNKNMNHEEAREYLVSIRKEFSAGSKEYRDAARSLDFSESEHVI